MYAHYSKVYVVRDCFGLDQLEGNLKQINEILSKNNMFIHHQDIFIHQRVTSIDIIQSEDDGSLDICFFNSQDSVCSLSTFDLKEIQMIFDIEEELETSELIYHGLEIKAFKEYQM